MCFPSRGDGSVFVRSFLASIEESEICRVTCHWELRWRVARMCLAHAQCVPAARAQSPRLGRGKQEQFSGRGRLPALCFTQARFGGFASAKFCCLPQ